MKFGMPTLIEFDNLEKCAQKASELKLDFVEINMSFPDYNAEELDVDELSRIGSKYNVFYTFHADESLNPFDFTASVSECYFNIMRKSIKIAKTVGAPIINMHLLKGVYATLPSKVVLLSDVYIDRYLQRVREFIAMCEKEIAEAPLKIAIENVDTSPFTSFQIKALELFMKSEAFGLTLDVGHDFCMNGLDKPVFEKYSGKLLHMHLHDSDGSHAHLPLGDGKVNIAEKLSLLTENSTCLIEVKTASGLEKSMNYLNNERVIL